MSKIEAPGPQSNDSSDWNRAWNAVSRLAAARGTALPKTEEKPEEVKPADAPQAAPTPPRSRPAADFPGGPLARDQLIAEIEQAAAALRRAEPGLAPRLANSQARSDLRRVRSVWILIALIWLSAASVVSCAIFLLFG